MLPVFISHASEDKARLLPLIRALRLYGLPVFLDNPHQLNLSLEETHALGLNQLKANDDWKAALEVWLAKTVVLICLSNSFKNLAARGVLQDEVSFAHRTRRWVGCIIEPLDHATFAPNASINLMLQKQVVPLDCAALARALGEGGAAMLHDPSWVPVAQLVEAINEVCARRIVAGDVALPNGHPRSAPITHIRAQTEDARTLGRRVNTTFQHAKFERDIELVFVPSGTYTLNGRQITLPHPYYVSANALPTPSGHSPDDIRRLVLELGGQLPSESLWEVLLHATAMDPRFEAPQQNGFGLTGTHANQLELVEDYYSPNRVLTPDATAAPGLTGGATFKSTAEAVAFRTSRPTRYAADNSTFRLVFPI